MAQESPLMTEAALRKQAAAELLIHRRRAKRVARTALKSLARELKEAGLHRTRIKLSEEYWLWKGSFFTTRDMYWVEVGSVPTRIKVEPALVFEQISPSMILEKARHVLRQQVRQMRLAADRADQVASDLEPT
jgi:hypothetical protein